MPIFYSSLEAAHQIERQIRGFRPMDHFGGAIASSFLRMSAAKLTLGTQYDVGKDSRVVGPDVSNEWLRTYAVEEFGENQRPLTLALRS